MSKNCWFLKEKIVSLYYHVYLDQENVLLEDQRIINEITEILINDFKKICKSINSQQRILIKSYLGFQTLKETKLKYLETILLKTIEVTLEAEIYSTSARDSARNKQFKS